MGSFREGIRFFRSQDVIPSSRASLFKNNVPYKSVSFQLVLCFIRFIFNWFVGLVWCLGEGGSVRCRFLRGTVDTRHAAPRALQCTEPGQCFVGPGHRRAPGHDGLGGHITQWTNENTCFIGYAFPEKRCLDSKSTSCGQKICIPHPKTTYIQILRSVGPNLDQYLMMCVLISVV